MLTSEHKVVLSEAVAFLKLVADLGLGHTSATARIMVDSLLEVRADLGDMGRAAYFVNFEYDTLTDGRGVVVAKDPGLPGCMAQGNTIQETLKSLAVARLDYISILEKPAVLKRRKKREQIDLLNGMLFDARALLKELVSDTTVRLDDSPNRYEFYLCPRCGKSLLDDKQEHAPDCLFVRAREWLEKTAP